MLRSLLDRLLRRRGPALGLAILVAGTCAALHAGGSSPQGETTVDLASSQAAASLSSRDAFASDGGPGQVRPGDGQAPGPGSSGAAFANRGGGRVPGRGSSRTPFANDGRGGSAGGQAPSGEFSGTPFDSGG